MMECLSKARKELHIISDNIDFVGGVAEESIVEPQSCMPADTFSRSDRGFSAAFSSTGSNFKSQAFKTENKLIDIWKTLDCVDLIHCMYKKSEDLFQLIKAYGVVLYSKENLSNVKIEKICPNPLKEDKELEDFYKNITEVGEYGDDDNDFSRAIHLIMPMGNTSLLQHFADVNNIDIATYHYKSFSLLHFAARYGASDIIDYFIKNSLIDVNCRNDTGNTPLYFAAKHEKVEAIQILINNHADVNVKDKDGYTPLHVAAGYDAVSSIETLINNHADVNAKDENGWSPLHFAAFYDALSSIETLINNNADVNAKNSDGCTPLHIAVYYDKVAAMKILLENNADMNEEMKTGHSVIDLDKSEEAKAIIKKYMK